MRIATHNWNVREVGKDIPASYYGYKTKKEAVQFANNWNANHNLKVEVVKYTTDRKWVKVD